MKRSGNGWSAKCPGHDDQHASLSISTGEDGRILLKCHAGCETAKITGSLGLTVKDLFPEKQSKKERPRIAAVYYYPGGVQKVRYADKSFSWRQPDSKGGWTYNRKGVTPSLYVAGSLGGAVCVCEGEKDADSLHRLGYNAASGADGAGHGKWLKQYTEERDAALDALRADCAESIDAALKSMQDALSHRAIVPPTPEQVAILQVLQMRDKLDERELEQAAVAVSGNPLCIGIVDELAKKHGCIRRYSGYAAQFPDGEARERVQYLARSARKLLHGEGGYTSNAAATDSKESVISRMGAFPASIDDHGGRYQEAVVNTKLIGMFCEAVDGVKED